MRNIKYRGVTTKGKTIYGSLVVTNAFLTHKQAQHTKTWIVESAFGNGGWFNIRSRSYVKPESVGQLTGLKDKNGVDIYEGDICAAHSEKIRIFESKDRQRTGKFSTKYYLIEYRDKSASFCIAGSALSSISQNVAGKYYEVVGNIYENPELLK